MKTEEPYQKLWTDQELSDPSLDSNGLAQELTSTSLDSNAQDKVYVVLNAEKSQKAGRAQSVLRALVVVLSLLCILLLAGIIVLLSRKTGNTAALLPQTQASHDMQDQKFCFPKHTDTTYAKITADYEEPLTHVTLCMRYKTQYSRKEQSLFSFATPSYHNAILLFIEKTGKFSFSINNKEIITEIISPPGKWNSVCASWSNSGEVYLSLNENTFLLRRIASDESIQINPIILIGQEQDDYGSRLDISQCFVGEVSDVYLWGHGRSTTLVKDFMQMKLSPSRHGVLISWRALNYTLTGHVSVMSNMSLCSVS